MVTPETQARSQFVKKDEITKQPLIKLYAGELMVQIAIVKPAGY